MPSTTSFDPTEYVQKQRVTKTTPPKPAYNPLQFIQIKPCNLYQSAQDQLRKAEEVKKAKVTKKEDAEEWQGVSHITFTLLPNLLASLAGVAQSCAFTYIVYYVHVPHIEVQFHFTKLFSDFRRMWM